SVVIVAGGRDGKIDQAAFGVEREGRPYVGVSGDFFGTVLPSVVAELAFLRVGVEGPREFSGAGVPCADVAGRIVLVDQAIGDSVAVRNLAVFVGSGIVAPRLPAGVGIECDDAIVARADVQNAVDYQGRVLEIPWVRFLLFEWPFAGFPFPGDFQTCYICTVYL